MGLLTDQDRASIRASVAATRAVNDPTVPAKVIAESYVAALPDLGDAVLLAAHDAAEEAVQSIRAERGVVVEPRAHRIGSAWCPLCERHHGPHDRPHARLTRLLAQ